MARSNPYQRPDHRTREAKARGFPARSVFKLEEIDRRVRLLRQGQHVLDLGAAPGSWSMYASQRVGPSGRVLAIDIAPVAKSLGPNVTFIQASARTIEDEALRTFAPYHVILSDMAPSTSGDAAIDHFKSVRLYLRALELAVGLGAPGATFVAKIFMGESFEEARDETRKHFKQVRIMRPRATRSHSIEVFIVGLDLLPPAPAPVEPEP